MPRIPRMLVKNETAVYHVISRTALDGFPFQVDEKEAFLAILRRYSQLFLTEVLGFCLMGNHFHLLVRMLPEQRFSDRQIRQRFEAFYGESRVLTEGQMPCLRAKLENLSEYIKAVKHAFSIDYNRRHDRAGTLWAQRFKSVIVEDGDTLVHCLAYIDLNPVRAGLVQRPEQYRWSSLGYHVQRANRGHFLSLDLGLAAFGEMSTQERLRRYRRHVYEAGAIAPANRPQAAVIDAEILESERARAFSLGRIRRFRYRTRHFTDSGVIGSRGFVAKLYRRFRHNFISSKPKEPKPIEGLEGIYSLKGLSEER
jgi:REP element-mobilizing transposase RayT